MPTLPKEILTDDERRRRDAFTESRSMQRRRTRFYGQADGPLSAGAEDAVFTHDSKVGRNTAFNSSQLPRRRLGSYYQGIHYTGVNPIKAEFHQCSRDLERREACENFLADQLIDSGVLWAVAQVVLQFSDEEFMFLLTQEQMFQDLWGVAPIEQRSRKRRGSGVGGSVSGTGNNDEMREATLDDLSPSARELLKTYKHGWTKLKVVSPVGPARTGKDQDKAPRFDLLAQQLGYSFYKMRRRVQSLIMITGRMETFLWFQQLYNEGGISVAQIRKAVAADEAHFAMLSDRKSRPKTARSQYANAVTHHELVLKKLGELGKVKGLERNVERINELVKQERRLLAEKNKFAKIWDDEKEEKEIRGSKARHKKAELKALTEKGALEKTINDNFDALVNRKKSGS